MQEQTDIFGIPVPSTDKLFLAFVVLHIIISMAAVICGLAAMLTVKGSPFHTRWGTAYFWLMITIFGSVVVLSVMRWPHNIHLLSIGTLAAATSWFGRFLARKKRGNWTRFHTVVMSASYILLLTGFYVDNGKNLPFWRMFPQWFFYIFPTTIGIPIIWRVLLKHPLTKSNGDEQGF